jgi:hypothetical protein
MRAGNVKPLYVYLPMDQHDFIDHLKQDFGINKSDAIMVLLTYVQKFWKPEDIHRLFETMLILGEEGIEKVA